MRRQRICTCSESENDSQLLDKLTGTNYLCSIISSYIQTICIVHKHKRALLAFIVKPTVLFIINVIVFLCQITCIYMSNWLFLSFILMLLLSYTVIQFMQQYKTGCYHVTPFDTEGIYTSCCTRHIDLMSHSLFKMALRQISLPTQSNNYNIRLFKGSILSTWSLARFFWQHN